MASSGEGRPESPKRREFLKTIGAFTALTATGVGSNAEAASAREREKLIEKVKDENTMGRRKIL